MNKPLDEMTDKELLKEFSNRFDAYILALDVLEEYQDDHPNAEMMDEAEYEQLMEYKNDRDEALHHCREIQKLIK